MRQTFIVACVALLVGGLAASAGAATISYTDSIALQSTNWSSSVSVPKFNSSLGTLNSISFSLAGHVEGDGQFESLDASPAEVIMDLQATLKLKRPNNTLLVQTIPVVETTDNVTAYDGVQDYAGTSGKSYSSVAGDQTESMTTSTVADKTLFTGVGNISLPATATGSSYASGPGNIATLFHTSASAGVMVTYDYTPVPEPASLLTLALGILGTVGLVLRKRSA